MRAAPTLSTKLACIDVSRAKSHAAQRSSRHHGALAAAAFIGALAAPSPSFAQAQASPARPAAPPALVVPRPAAAPSAPPSAPAPSAAPGTPTPGPDSPQALEARELFTEGVALAEQERWGEALAYFQRSLALVRRPNTLFNMGNALFRLGRAREAVNVFDEFLRVANPERDAARLVEAQRLRDQSYAAIASLVFTVTPADADVRIDGELVPNTGAVRQLRHDPGSHTVEVSAANYAPSRFTVALLPGSRTRRDVELTRSQSANGFLDLDTNVRTAAVRVDGRLLGRGPARYEVPSGRRLLLLSAPGFRDAERTVSLLPGQSLRMTLRLRPENEGPAFVRSPVFWVVAGLVVVAGAGVAIAATTLGPGEYGGSAGVVLPTSGQ